MVSFFGRRLLILVPVLWAATTLAFLLVRAAPGDPVDVMLGPRTSGASQVALTAAQRAELRQRYGLDRPLPLQYVAWLERLVHGDLGTSIRSRRPVLDELRQRMPATAALAGAAMAVNIVLVIALGLAGASAGGWIDHLIRVFSLLLVAVPSFWLGMLLLWLFAVHWQWITVTGPATPQRLLLPAITLGLALAPRGIRVLRASLLDVRSRPHVMYARAKGLRERHIWLDHTLPVALLPVATLLGLNLTGLLTGSVIAESVFAWPGIGLYVVEAILNRDYPVVQGYVVLVTTIAIFGSVLTDLLYAVLDPRVRQGSGGD